MDPYPGAAGYTNLCSKYAPFSDGDIMSNLYKVINLCPTSYYGISHCPPVYGCIGSYLHIVLNNNTTDLWYLVVNTFMRCISKSVAPYNSAAVYYDPAPNPALFAYCDIWIDDRAYTYRRTFTYKGERVNSYIIPYYYPVLYIYVRIYRYIIPYLHISLYHN